MKPRTLWLTIAVAPIALLVIPVALKAEQAHGYKLVEIGTFGGPNSYLTFITKPLNEHGIATGSADASYALNPPFCLIDCFAIHAFVWKDGAVTDLGALPSVGASFPNGVNERGVVAGASFNGGSLPVIGGVPTFDAVVWKGGQVIDLGTFGGVLSYSAAINNRDQVVGFALNTTPDSFDLGDSCENFQMPTQMRAFVWDGGAIEDLGTLGGTDSCALFVNDRGEVAGNSFTNSTVNPSTGLPTLHPFLWTRQVGMKDLGTLGGTLAFANGINSRGQIGGASTLLGDQVFHAFLWHDGTLRDFGSLGGSFMEVVGLNENGDLVGQASLPDSTFHAFLASNGTMMDLGTQNGNPCSFAAGINARDQVVGFTHDCSFNNQHPFLWENGQMTDLNVFVPAGSDLTLFAAAFINDRGEIAAEGVLPNGDQRAVLLIPCGSEEGNNDGGNDGGCRNSAEIPANTMPRHEVQSPRTARPVVSAWRARLARRYH